MRDVTKERRDLDKIIGIRLRAYRMMREMSQKDVADAAQVDLKVIQEIEDDKRAIEASLLVFLLDLFDAEPEQVCQIYNFERYLPANK